MTFSSLPENQLFLLAQQREVTCNLHSHVIQNIHNKFIKHKYLSLSLNNCRPQQQLKQCHQSPIFALDIDKQESRYLLAAGNDVLSLHDLHHPSLPLQQCNINIKSKTHKRRVSCVIWYPIDNGMFISGSHDGKVIVWDTNQFTDACTFQLNKPVFSVAMANNRCNSVDNNPNQCNRLLNVDVFNLIAVGSQSSDIHMCDMISNSFTHCLKTKKIRNKTNNVRSLCWHPSNKYYLASGSDDGCIRVWDIRRPNDTLHEICCSSLKKSSVNIDDERVIDIIWCSSSSTLSYIYCLRANHSISKWRVNNTMNEMEIVHEFQDRAMTDNCGPSYIYQNMCIDHYNDIIIGCCDCNILLINAVNGLLFKTIKSSFVGINAMCLIPNRNELELIAGDVYGNLLTLRADKNCIGSEDCDNYEKDNFNNSEL